MFLISGIGLVGQLQAAPQLRVTDGINTVIVADGGVNDLSAQPGVVTFSGPIGSFVVTVSTGTSDPVYGSPTDPYLHLGSLDVSGSSGGTIWVAFSDDNFGPTPYPTFTAPVGGTTQGTAEYNTYLSTANVLFDGAFDPTGAPPVAPTLLTSVGPFGPGAFSTTSAVSLPSLAQPYALTIEAVVKHPGGQMATSFSADLINTPGTGQLGDFVWNDINADGVQAPAEAGINGVTVNLYDCTGMFIATTSTANHPVSSEPGYYLFDGLPEGCYRVEFIPPSGFVFSPNDQGSDDSKDSDANTATGVTGDINLPAGASDLTWDAGLYQPASIGDFVWHDINANGIQDSGEPGLPNIVVYLYDCLGNKIKETLTDANGYYSFGPLPPGDYYVQVFPPVGYAVSPQDQGSDDSTDSDADDTGKMACTNLSPGENDKTWDAGLYVPAAIGNFVWLDANGNGIQDSGESGVPGVKVNLYTCDGTPVDSMLTDSNGEYLFTGLTPGDYYVQFELPAGYDFSPKDQGSDDEKDSDADETTGKTTCTNLVSNETDLTWDAGIVRLCPPSIELVKTAVNTTVPIGGSATYKYVVKNTGCTILTDIVVTDDNGTPDYAGDDFIVGTVASLDPGESVEFTKTVLLAIELCGPPAGGSTEAGLLITQLLPGGDVKVTFIQSFNRNDNTYGVNSIGWKPNRPHRFRDLLNSDHVVFSVKNGSGTEVLKFKQDYVSVAPTSSFPSGYGTLGVSGGDGGMQVGSSSQLYGFASSLGDNLNKPPFISNLAQYTVNSPALSDPNSPLWEYRMIYQFIVKASAFGSSGFGGVVVVDQHNSPPKSGEQSFQPNACGGCVVNKATVVATSGDIDVSASDDAEVCSGTPPTSTPPSSPGTGTPGFWMNHPEAWPYDSIQIGGTTYTKDEAINLMKKPVKSDKTYNMFAQLVSAILNVAIGNESSCISSTIASAQSWMEDHPVGSGVKASSQAWTEGSPLHETLDKYNNGHLCAPHRD